MSRESATAAATPDARSERRLRWSVAAGYAGVRALASTWRFRLLRREPVEALRAAGEPLLFAFWHGHMLPLLYLHRDEGVAILISEHRDGELITRVAHRFGFRSVRGSTTRGAGRALLGMVRVLESGDDVAITPDGPRGPSRRFAPGGLVAAQRSGAHVVPVSLSADRAWRLRSWDSFLIPKPFARITVAYGPPTRVVGETAREAAAETERFEALLGDAEALAVSAGAAAKLR